MVRLSEAMIEAGSLAFLDALSDDVPCRVAAQLIWQAMIDAKAAEDAEHYRATFEKMNTRL